MASNRKRQVAALISLFIVGGGQVYSRRYWAGLWFAVFFYGIIIFISAIWRTMNPGFWAAFGSLAVFWLYNVLDAYRGYHYPQPPCEKACPAGIAPWLYVNNAGSQAKWKYPFIPFFRVLGLICPAPCEPACTRRGIDEPVAIRELKSAVDCDQPQKAARRGKQTIGVIGAGPCGLTLAYELARRGYEIIVYEKDRKPGGVPAALIPEFRLPQAVLQSEINDILKTGFEIKYGIKVGCDITIDDLLEKHDFLFLATGAWMPVTLDVPGEDSALVGLDILRGAKNGERFDLGHVGVIGGGNTAIDVARTLKRMGNDVKIFYRRRIQDMPAEPENKLEAAEEGIEIVPLTTPVRVVKESIFMVRTECSGEGSNGVVKILEGTEFDVKLDNIVMAVGQKPDTDLIAKYVKVDEMSRVVTRNGRTTHPRIYAGGDVVLGTKTIAHAVGHGITIAQELNLRARGVPAIFRGLLKNPFLPDVISMLNVNDSARIKISHRPVTERLLDFKPSEEPVSPEQLKVEANRCLTCSVRYK